MANSNPNIPTVDILEQDPITGLVTRGTCTGTPPVVAGIFDLDCELIDDAGSGIYKNTGTVASPTWSQLGTIASLATNKIFVGSAGGTAVAQTMSGDATIVASGALTIANSAVTTAKILDANVTLGKLSTGITPYHVVKYAGKITWSGSGASLATTVTGVLSTDIVLVTIQTAPTQAVYVKSAAPTTDTVTITLSAANTSNDAVIGYTVYRAAA